MARLRIFFLFAFVTAFQAASVKFASDDGKHYSSTFVFSNRILNSK